MVRIITDSCADFEAHELEQMGVTAIPLNVIFGDEEYKENINLTKEQFYEKLTSSPHHPTTSQPTPEDYLNVLEPCKADGDEVVGIFISSKLSGTYQGANLAKQLAEYDECYLIDSLSATVGERMFIEYAVKLRDEGHSAKEIYEKIEAVKEKLNIYAAVETLEYLKKGGRISSASAAIGTLANLKPIIHVGKEGVVETAAKAIGLRKATSTLVKFLEDAQIDTDFPVYLVYSHVKDNAVTLGEALAKNGYDIPEDRVYNIGAAIGTHVGPGAFGLVYMEK